MPENNREGDIVVLYHAYGTIENYRQVLFSILTLHYYLQGGYSGVKIVVYTDNPNFFEAYRDDLPLHMEYLSAELISMMKGENGFVHRVKVCIIDQCFGKYKSHILYLDSDTYFTAHPASLFQKILAGCSVMNSNDYDLLSADELYENNDWLLIRRAIKNYYYTIKNEVISIPLTTRMWNAGVIGINYQYRHVLGDVLDLTDQIYKNKPVFTAEQFAFSYFLQNGTSLHSSGDVIFHYWPNFGGMYWKQTYNYHLKIFFKRYRHLLVGEQANQAYLLSRKHESLRLPARTIIEKVYDRVQLVAKVAFHGNAGI